MNLIKYFRGRMSAVRRDHLAPIFSSLFLSFFLFCSFFPRHGAIYFFNVRNELNALYPFLFRRVPFSHPVLPIPASRAIVSPLLPLSTSAPDLHFPSQYSSIVRAPSPLDFLLVFYLFRAARASCVPFRIYTPIRLTTRREHFRSRDNLYISIPKNPDDSLVYSRTFVGFRSISSYQRPNRVSSLLLNFYRGTEFVEADIYIYISLEIATPHLLAFAQVRVVARDAGVKKIASSSRPRM